MTRYSILTVEDLLQLDPEDLKLLWNDLPRLFQDALALHPRVSPLALWWMAKSSPDWAWRISCSREHLPPEMVWDMLLPTAGSHDGLWSIPTGAFLTPDMLMALTDLGGLNVRFDLAEHRDSNAPVLARLSRDPDLDIRRKAAKRLRAEDRK